MENEWILRKRIFFFYNYRLHFYWNTIEFEMMAGWIVSTKHDDSPNFLELDLLFYQDTTTTNSFEWWILLAWSLIVLLLVCSGGYLRRKILHINAYHFRQHAGAAIIISLLLLCIVLCWWCCDTFCILSRFIDFLRCPMEWCSEFLIELVFS